MMAQIHIFLQFLILLRIPVHQRPLRHPPCHLNHLCTDNSKTTPIPTFRKGAPRRLTRCTQCQSHTFCNQDRKTPTLPRRRRSPRRFPACQSSILCRQQRRTTPKKKHPAQQSRRDYQRQHFRFGKGLKNIAIRRAKITKVKSQKKSRLNHTGGRNQKRKMLKGRKCKRPRNIVSKKSSNTKKQLMKSHRRVTKAKHKVKKTRKAYCNKRAKKCCFEAKDGRNRMKIKKRRKRLRYHNNRKPRSDNDLGRAQLDFLERSSFGEQH